MVYTEESVKLLQLTPVSGGGPGWYLWLGPVLRARRVGGGGRPPPQYRPDLRGESAGWGPGAGQGGGVSLTL